MSVASPPVQRLLTPLRSFLHLEAAGGIVLVGAAIVALIWANSPWQAGYETLWSTELEIGLGDHHFGLSLQEWVNDGLMAIFFLVVGLEIKRELVQGELRDPHLAALPAIAALGGMIVPALLYLSVNVGGEGVDGWGIPMATDIAMALGAMSLVRSRVHPSLPLFLLALAIVDDIGAILVIAIFYSAGVDTGWLALAAGMVGLALLGRVAGIVWVPSYVALGIVLWFSMHEAGVHATLAGVVMGLLAPTNRRLDPDDIEVAVLADISSPEAARETISLARHSVSVVERLEHVLHPWSSFLIVPVFALANAGIEISTDVITDAASSPVSLGVVLGLVVGKPVGITLAAYVACRSGVARLPPGAEWRDILGAGALGGIGFTVSIFVASLAFRGETLDLAKLGVLGGSVISAAIGLALLRSGDLEPASEHAAR
jgi:Na+:H+ antiporter, NhaA family